MDTDKATSAARQAGDSRAVEWGARLGYGVMGLLHLLIAWIALRVAWGKGGGSADQSGALATIAGTAGGLVLLWVAVVGFVLLAVWQLSVAVTGGREGKASERLAAGGKAVMYAAVGWSAFKFTAHKGSSSSSSTKDFTATLMEHSGGRLLVGLIGLAVLGGGGFFVWKGWTEKFLEDLQKHPGAWVVQAGRVGYIAKGVAYGVVGLLFLVAAVHRSPGRATGLDGALRSLREQPLGQWLLSAVALGLAAFGVYCFARARYEKI